MLYIQKNTMIDIVKLKIFFKGANAIIFLI